VCGVLTLFTASYSDSSTELSCGVKGKDVPVLHCPTMKVFWGKEVTMHTFLTSALNGGDFWLMLCPQGKILWYSGHDGEEKASACSQILIRFWGMKIICGVLLY